MMYELKLKKDLSKFIPYTEEEKEELQKLLETLR